MPKKGIVIYDTSYGNTQKISETIAETLKASGFVVDLFRVKDVKKLSAKDYDFLVIGSPTHFGTLTFPIRGLLGKLKGEEWLNKGFAAFDTENPANEKKSMELPDEKYSAAAKIAGKLKEKRMTELAPILRAVVLGIKGPLVQGEIERAREYAKELSAKLEEQVPLAVSE
jgi:flavodoxin